MPFWAPGIKSSRYLGPQTTYHSAMETTYKTYTMTVTANICSVPSLGQAAFKSTSCINYLHLHDYLMMYGLWLFLVFYRWRRNWIQRWNRPRSLHSVRIGRQTQVSWLQSHYFSSITSSFQVVPKIPWRVKGCRGKLKRWTDRAWLISLVQISVKTSVTCWRPHTLDAMEFFLCLGLPRVWLRDESQLSPPQPRTAFSSADIFLPVCPRACFH